MAMLIAATSTGLRSLFHRCSALREITAPSLAKALLFFPNAPTLHCCTCAIVISVCKNKLTLALHKSRLMAISRSFQSRQVMQQFLLDRLIG